MVNIYDEIAESFNDIDEQEKLEIYLAGFNKWFDFTLCPAQYARSNDLPALTWHSFKYTEHEAQILPDEQGVYMFMVQFSGANLPTNSYVMYVGKAGDIGSNNTIAKRFRDYVNPSGYSGRIKVSKMIKHFSEHLVYYYATIPANQSTADVEQALADIFIPPCCKVDFSANMRTLLRGAGIL